MPYPFAHPAAVLPLMRPLGRLAVPPALVIGSIVPDAWYLFPGMARSDSHGPAGLLWFCLPLGFVLYLLWNGARPRAPFPAVAVSLAVGTVTHFGWDAVAHSYAWHGVNVLQHASTLAGTAFVVWWLTARPGLALLAAASLAAAGAAAYFLAPDLAALRALLRDAGAVAAWILAASLVAWRLISAPATAPRSPRAPSRRRPGR